MGDGLHNIWHYYQDIDNDLYSSWTLVEFTYYHESSEVGTHLMTRDNNALHVIHGFIEGDALMNHVQKLCDRDNALQANVVYIQ